MKNLKGNKKWNKASLLTTDPNALDLDNSRIDPRDIKPGIMEYGVYLQQKKINIERLPTEATGFQGNL